MYSGKSDITDVRLFTIITIMNPVSISIGRDDGPCCTYRWKYHSLTTAAVTTRPTPFITTHVQSHRTATRTIKTSAYGRTCHIHVFSRLMGIIEMLAEISDEGRHTNSRMAVISYQQQSQEESQVWDRDECEYHEKSWRKHENGRMIQQESGRHLQSESVS